MPGRIIFQTRERKALTSAPLVKHDDTVHLWVKELSVPSITASPRPPMKEDDRVA